MIFSLFTFSPLRPATKSPRATRPLRGSPFWERDSALSICLAISSDTIRFVYPHWEERNPKTLSQKGELVRLEPVGVDIHFV